MRRSLSLLPGFVPGLYPTKDRSDISPYSTELIHVRAEVSPGKYRVMFPLQVLTVAVSRTSGLARHNGFPLPKYYQWHGNPEVMHNP